MDIYNSVGQMIPTDRSKTSVYTEGAP